MSEKEPHSDSRIALFIDIENLLGGASTIGLPLDVGPILRELKVYGKVQYRKCFGDILKTLKSVGREREIDRIRIMLQSNCVNIEDVPYMTAHKNSADIRLVIDALSLAYQYKDITHFAIVASDRDYVPLFNKLNELSRTVIAIGVDKENTNPVFITSSDHLIYYEALFLSASVEKASDEEKEDVEVLLESYFELLLQAIRLLENSGRKAGSAAVLMAMRQLRSDFSPELVKLDGFKEFIDKAVERKIVEIFRPGGGADYILTKPSAARQSADENVTQAPEPGKAIQAIKEHYQQILESRLRIPWPDRTQRQTIVTALHDAYQQLIQNGSFELLSLSDTTCENLWDAEENISSSAVYKIALSLYFGRCFHCEPGYNKHNPFIVGLATGEADWERKLNEVLIRSVNMRNQGEKVAALPMSLLLFESDDDEYVQRTEEMIGEVCAS